MTKWKTITEFPNYEVSDDGRVRNIKTGIEKKPELHQSMPGLFYYRTDLYSNNIREHCYIHVLVAKAFIHNPENKPTVNHINGDKLNNNDWNLEWATMSEQLLHACRVLGERIGEKHCRAKLTIQQVLQIRKDYWFWKVTMKSLAEKYEVSEGTIQDILKRKTWKHI